MWFFTGKARTPTKEEALPGRPERMVVPASHFVNGHKLEPPFPAGTQLAMFGMGCFWGRNGSSGSGAASIRRPSATREGSPSTPPTKRCAAG